MASTPNGPSTLGISTSEAKDDQQNTPSEDALVITISGTASGFNGDHRAELEDTPDNVIVSYLDLFITKTHGVITLEAEPADHGSEPKVTSCHVATSIREEITTSFISANVEDMAERM